MLISLDNVSSAIGSDALSVMDRLKLVIELGQVRKDLVSSELTNIERLHKIKRLGQIRSELMGTNQQSHPSVSNSNTGAFYAFDENRKMSQRKKDNKDAMDLLAKIQGGDIDPKALSNDHKAILAKYSGTGGALVGADGKKGSAYEYYTPKPIAEGIWHLLEGIGFSGGKVLDPCAGTGIFGATAPSSAIIDTVELNETSGLVNKYVNERPGYTATIAPFERVAASTPDGEYDAVVTNVPFGGVADRGGNQLLDPKYQKEPLQNYFILRSLEKLRGGGLAAFITPPRCVSGKGGKEEELRLKSSYIAEFLGAYRLPNSVFGSASADTITDVIFYKKYSDETIEHIETLREQNPQVLIDSGIVWADFINGRYFDTEGKRFVLGEFVPKDPNKIRDVDRVINPLSVPDISKLMKKFTSINRINWDLLNSKETEFISYQNGDTKTQAGQTFEYNDGSWRVILKSTDASIYEALSQNMSTPFSAFNAGVTFEQADGYLNYMKNTSQHLDVPGWLKLILSEDKIKQYWKTALVALVVAQLLDVHSSDSNFNYLDEYNELSVSMLYQSKNKNFKPQNQEIKRALKLLKIHAGKGVYSPLWKGETQQEVQIKHLSEDHSFEGIRYTNKSHWVSVNDMKSLYGVDFDPLDLDSEWVVSNDGLNVTKKADYYVGSFKSFDASLSNAIKSTNDDRLKNKLVRQKIDAQTHLDVVNVEELDFNLFTPHVTVEEKAEFLRRYIHPSAHVAFDDKTGKKWADINVKATHLNDKDKLLNRLGDYMKNGSITLGGAKFSMPDDAALRELRKLSIQANEQFNAWVKGNKVILDRINQIANDPEKLRFKTIEDDVSLLTIPGMNPGLTLHSYQASYVKQQGREFGGGNAFDVGLGKTFTALAAVQHVQSMGIKKKTIFVVPNSVLSNWRKEASNAYQSIDDCLFVGLRTDSNGVAKVVSSMVDDDLHLIQENRHSKIFMTLEQFQRIRLKDDTILDFDSYMRKVDASFAESEDKKKDERNKSKLKDMVSVLADKQGAAPYLEDLGIDSIVIDEAHVFKNSSATVNFKSAKFLSLSEATKRGIDAQAKAWYIRDKSPLKDGVLLLTATPITNSPLEIYSMLTLAVGHERVNDSFLGIKGADDFMNMVCRKVNQDDMTMDGLMRTIDVFVGLDNVNVLRSGLKSIFTIKNADDVGASIVVPEAEEVSRSIQLPDTTKERLNLYKSAFRYAIDSVNDKPNRGDPEAYDKVQRHFGEDLNLIAHPFNLISKMTALIADPELDQRATFFYINKRDRDLALKVIDKFNLSNCKENRARPGPWTSEDAIIGKTIKKEDDTELLSIHVKAGFIETENKIWVDTITPKNQQEFEDIAAKMGLDMDVSIPPKLAALIENYNNEKAAPRGKGADGGTSSIVKQIIFCDILALHAKIRRLLIKKGSTPLSKIAIITGQTNNTPEEIIDIQDGFNAEGETNKYATVIANEKAEVGINLQKGTQAVHHLTIGWTPDSLTQRNGRGVRQGNKTARVNIYFYDADGTFDVFKRVMVGKKKDWISDVVNSEGGNAVNISGGLSKEQMEALIEVVGDSDAMTQLQQTAQLKEAEARAASNREKQLYNLDIITKSKQFISENPNPNKLVIQKIRSFAALKKQADLISKKIDNPNASASSVARNESLLADLNVRIDGIRDLLNNSVIFSNSDSLEAALEALKSRYDYKESKLDDYIQNRIYIKQVKEGSGLHSEWQSEIEMAKSMIEEAAKKAVVQSKMGGAYTPETITHFLEGDGIISSGKIIIPQIFIRKGNQLAVFGNNFRYSWLDFHKIDSGLDDDDSNTVYVYPGDSGYDQCLIDAAVIEDRLANEGHMSEPFSKIVSEVRSYRKTEGVVEYLIREYLIQGHHFPYVMRDLGTPVSRAICASQSEIVKSVRPVMRDGYFTVAASTSVAKYQGNNFHVDLLLALKDFAISNGLKLNAIDIGSIGAKISIPVEKALVEIEDATSEEEALNRLSSYLSEKFSWYDFQGDPLHEFSNSSEIIKKIKELKGVVDPESPDDLISIGGETYDYKDKIKTAAFSVGDRAKWDRASLTWRVKRKTWYALIESHPSAKDDLTLAG